MRVTALHGDVLVFVSDVWQTTCTAVRGGEEGFVIDSPVYPEELRALPEMLKQAGFTATGLLTTHGDWDHLLGRLAFPGAALGCAESTAQRLTAEPGAAQRRLREFDAEHYVSRLEPLALGTLQALPVPGKLELGSRDELELIPADGHTADGVAYWIPRTQTMVCGDYLSPVEIPMLSPGGSIVAYRATLSRLRPLAERADWVIPGHGAPIPGTTAVEILDADDAYLATLGSGAEPPEGRRSKTQRAIHEANLATLG